MDECISNRVALAVINITERREGVEVTFNRHGHAARDSDWIRKFAEEGGTAIVSGDHRILQHWPNLIAYTESGVISFFPPSEYEHLVGYGKAAFIIRWWPAIIEKVKVSERGDRWRLPMIWRATDHMKMKPIKDPRVDVDQEPEDTTKATQEPLDLRPPVNTPGADD